MKYVFRFVAFACLCGLLNVPATSFAQVKRYFTVRDSIEMAVFSRNAGSGRRDQSQFSPDGDYFTVLTTRGLLQTNKIESTIWLFETKTVEKFIIAPQGTRFLQPRRLVTMSGPSSHDQVNDESIIDMRWATDGRSVSFLGRNGTPERHLYVVDVKSGHVRQLSPDGQDVREFEQRDNTFVYSEVKPVSDSELYNAGDSGLPDIQVGTGQSLDALLFPRWQEVTWEQRPRQLWIVRDGKSFPVVDHMLGKAVSVRTDWFGSLCSLSPSGRFLVIKNYAERVPRAWESYQPAYESADTRIVADEPDKEPLFNATRPQQYELVNLQAGSITTLVDAPLGRVAGYGYSDETTVAWSADERAVALPNTFLPLDQLTPSGRPNPKRPCIAVVEIATKKAECVKESPLADLGRGAESIVVLDSLEWRNADQQLVANYSKFEGEDLLAEVFERTDGGWKSITDVGIRKSLVRSHLNRGISVSVRESINDPPVLAASDAQSGRSKMIWNPNPVLTEIDLGEAQIYRWRDLSGNEWTGGLLKPPGYVRGKRYPLVIQTHGFNQNEFLTDGFCPTANAARPLASRGIMVLQVGEIPRHWDTPSEAELDGRAGYVSAIEQLVVDGFVDPNKVGIIGFSHTGYFVLDSLIHAPQHFAAATLAEFFSGSFWQYLIRADLLSARAATEAASEIGSEPFGGGLNRWLEASPGFNTDKINVPVLFEPNYPVSLIAYWDIYAALRLQGKPVELLYMRNGNHVLTQPLERLASQEMNVDWYDFWLNAHEDPDPIKIEQFARWRRLRKQYESHRGLGENTPSPPPRRPGG